jgi:hypothetical protein
MPSSIIQSDPTSQQSECTANYAIRTSFQAPSLQFIMIPIQQSACPSNQQLENQAKKPTDLQLNIQKLSPQPVLTVVLKHYLHRRQ